MSVGLAKERIVLAGSCREMRDRELRNRMDLGVRRLGIAALAGSATWFALSAKRSKEKRKTQVSLSPTA